MRNITKLVHLSDLHVGRRKENTRTEQIIKWIASHHPGAPVLITGDLTRAGRQGQCETARELLTRLAQTNPVLTVPGNHDYGFLGSFFEKDSYRNFYSELAAPLGWPKSAAWSWLALENDNFLGVLEYENLVFFGLDSCDPTGKKAFANGWISQGLAERLDKELRRKKYAGKTRIVMLHHHPFEGTALTALHGTDRLMKAIQGRCDLMVFGHHHECGVWWKDRDVDLIVGSHKSTNQMLGKTMGIGLIEIRDPGTPDTRFEFQIEAVGPPFAKVA